MIRKFALRIIRADKTKGISAIIAMILTSILFSTLFTTIIGMNKASEYSEIKKSGMLSQIVLKDCDSKIEDAIEKIRSNDMVDSTGYRKYLADVVNDELSYNVELSYEDEVYSTHCFQDLKEGHMPEAENEIVMDESTIKALGIEKKIGASVPLNLKIGDTYVSEDFILSGWFELNNALEIKTGQVVTSKCYAKKWESNYTKNSIYGAESVDILLKNSKNVEEQAENLLTQVGLDLETVRFSVNPAYCDDTSTIETSSLLVMIVGILLIVIVGYLIINNIFHIATIRDAKEYGQLKTIGMTKKQIGALIGWQAVFLLIVAIPIGILVGLSIGEYILPSILSQTSFKVVAKDNLFEMKEIVVILAFSIIFVLVTTLLSIFGPIKIIGKLSPIESSRLELKVYNKSHKTTDGSKLHKFAFYNISRNKKNMIVIIISISLPILLASIAFSVLNSFDMDKYLSTMIYSDYKVATDNFFKNSYLTNEGEISSVSLDTIEDIEASGTVEDGGLIYGSCNNLNIVIENEKKSRDDYWLNLYGLDSFNLQEDMIVENDIDLTAFYDGTGILEGVWLNDDGSIMPGTSNYDTGDTVNIQTEEGKEKEYQVVGHLNIGGSVLNTGISGDNITYELYVDSNSYKQLVTEPQLMAYTFDVKNEQESNAEDVMKQITSSYPDVDYQSKTTYEEEFNTLKNMVELISILLCGVLSFIALINLINVFITSILVRKEEIGILRSIGMTRRQLVKMLLFEMLYYCGLAFIVSMILSILLSITMVTPFCNSISFLTYSLRPSVYVYILLIIVVISGVTVTFEEKQISKKSVTEQLRSV